MKGPLVAAISLGVLCLGTGYFAYRILMPNDEVSRVEKQITKSRSSSGERLPAVQFLASSGLEPVRGEALVSCKRDLGLKAEIHAPADRTNYGQRAVKDVLGRQIPNQPALIVLHETVLPAADTVSLFRTPHVRDADQMSYHVLIDRSGRLIRIVPDQYRAYGSGYSAFGDFTIHTKSRTNFSINNVALHISLESPVDGRGDADSHSGYTRNQYDTLAKQILLWQAAHGIPITRVTTHANVDRSHSRYDPRSFRWNVFDIFHRQHAMTCQLNQFILSE